MTTAISGRLPLRLRFLILQRSLPQEWLQMESVTWTSTAMETWSPCSSSTEKSLRSQITQLNYLTVAVSMLVWECMCKNAGAAGYAEAFTHVLSEKQASETYGWLSWVIHMWILSLFLPIQDQRDHTADEPSNRIDDPTDLPEAEHKSCDQEEDRSYKHDAPAPDRYKTIFFFRLRIILFVIHLNIELLFLQPCISQYGHCCHHKEQEYPVIKFFIHILRQR